MNNQSKKILTSVVPKTKPKDKKITFKQTRRAVGKHPPKKLR